MKLTKRFLGLALTLMVATVSTPMNVFAEESVQTMQIVETNPEVNNVEETYEGLNNFEQSPYMRGNSIIGANLTVTPRTNEILISMSTTANFTATKIGVREVYVQEKVWYGWKTIAQAADYTTNTNAFGGEASCTNAEKGKTYRVLCTHYAIDSNGIEHTASNQSTEFVYN